MRRVVHLCVVSKQFRSVSPLHAKVKAILFALQPTIDYGFNSLIIESYLIFLLAISEIGVVDVSIKMKNRILKQLNFIH